MSPAAALLDGSQLRSIFIAAAEHLHSSAKAVDAINVYPVPDGDTGSNMSATLSESVERTLPLGDGLSVAELLASLAKGALYGARGNSGVILSQALRGFALGVGDRPWLDAEGLAAGLGAAAAGAYAAVSKPQEGTMLTVLRAAAQGASAVAAGLPGNGRELPCAGVLEAASAAAERAEAATIDQLPALRAAGVTDAGGEGICVILRGMVAAIRGELPALSLLPSRAIASLVGHAADELGFCTEFMIESTDQPLDLPGLKLMAGTAGNTSVVVVGDETAARVHVHTTAPERVVTAGGTFGRVSRVKIEDMSAQNSRFEATGSGASKLVALLAVSHGEGFDAIFRSLGAAITSLGEATKPPAGAIASAADALRTPDVIVLTNHRNVILAAQQAAKISSCTLHVLPTSTLPEGIAAAIAFSGSEGARQNVANMDAARSAIRTVEVTTAAANRQADGVDARKGEAIAMVDGRLVISTMDPLDALIAGLERANAAGASLITLYGGAEVDAGTLDSARERIASTYAGMEIEMLVGGQLVYPFIASVE
ncbi:MAG: DAK2 domain-containing protein [Anaerolineaceae bacterium]